ncbi:MAG: 16S rRNA (uracil(1498)-N(3))-methyltransferase [Clostridiales bacterium]|nr:16S rRNA (uracil(1498)-N(3))-methyltransferase [Clostridiales bacterium]
MRFYLQGIDENKAELTGEAHTHAAYAMRIRTGDFITVFDGRGTEYSCQISAVKKDRTELKIIDKKTNVGETQRDYTLYISVIKQDRFEFAVQKATELGVGRIVPVYTTYTQRGGSLNIERLNRIVVAACEQCGRSKLPVVENCIEFEELIARTKNTHMIFPWERERRGTLHDAIDKTQKNISVFIGPEGGITEDEAARLTQAGAKPVTLGSRILRAETAAITTLSVICFELGEWDL